MNGPSDILTCADLAIGHGSRVIMDRLNLSLPAGKILAIVGPSGCGKSTLMRALGGLDAPLGGKTTLMGLDLNAAQGPERQDILRRTGFLFQGSALFSSLTLRENIEMPMREFLKAPRQEIRQLAEYKLALVGLADAMDKLPSEISGGMAKRAGIARAMALDPEVIFLDEPLGGKTTLMGLDLNSAHGPERQDILRRTGFLFQGSALFSSLTLLENIEMPMREFLKAPRREIRQLAEYKLALVGLADAMDKLPSEISGGMAKRAGIARAMALDPEVIFLDEPSAGLDPVSSGRLDELILRLREAFGTTVVLVSHEIPSILRTADFCVYLDPDTGTMGAYGPPKSFLQAGQPAKVHAFFSQARFE